MGLVSGFIRGDPSAQLNAPCLVGSCMASPKDLDVWTIPSPHPGASLNPSQPRLSLRESRGSKKEGHESPQDSRAPLPFIEVGESNSHGSKVRAKPIRVEAAGRALSHLDDHNLGMGRPDTEY